MFLKSHNFLYQTKKVYNFEVENWHTYFVGLWALLVHNAEKCLSQMMKESQKWFQNMMRGRNFNLAMNLFSRNLAEEYGKIFSKEVYVKLAKGGTKSGKGYIDAVIDGVGLERKATDVLKVTEETLKSYIRDAGKYSKAIIEETGDELAETVYLQVEKNADKISDAIKQYAKERKVEIIDDITQIFK